MKEKHVVGGSDSEWDPSQEQQKWYTHCRYDWNYWFNIMTFLHFFEEYS